jgi:cell wall-associated NlpC family hydrolase
MQDRKTLTGAAVIALVALAALTTACASSGAARPRPFPMPAGSATPPPTPAAEPKPIPTPTLIDTALSFRGTPYRNGGSDPTGFDCSGFTQWVYAQHGVAIPREVQEQFKAGKKIDLDDLKPGDLVFFHTVSRGASHVGIFVADDQFIHAPSSKGVVRVESLNSSYWSPRLVGVRRVQPVAPAPPAPAVVRQRPSAGESTVAAAAAGRSGARGSRAAD